MANFVGVVLLVCGAVAGLASGWIFVALLLGLIPAAIARSKGSRSFFAWWAFGGLFFILALPVALLRRDDTKEELKLFLAREKAKEETARNVMLSKLAASADGVPIIAKLDGLGELSREDRKALAHLEAGTRLTPLFGSSERGRRRIELYNRQTRVGYAPAEVEEVIGEQLAGGKAVNITVVDIAMVSGVVAGVYFALHRD